MTLRRITVRKVGSGYIVSQGGVPLFTTKSRSEAVRRANTLRKRKLIKKLRS